MKLIYSLFSLLCKCSGGLGMFLFLFSFASGSKAIGWLAVLTLLFAITLALSCFFIGYFFRPQIEEAKND